MSHVKMTSQKSKSLPETITAKLLKSWPLPVPQGESDKNTRGELTVIAGSYGMPGAAILSSVAALRSGAGKLQVATPRSILPLVAQSVPESLVIALDEEKPGILKESATRLLLKNLESSKSVLIGCGMDAKGIGKQRLYKLLKALLENLESKNFVIDACALTSLSGKSSITKKSHHKIVITPHAGEMAALTGFTREYVLSNAKNVAASIAREFGITVVMKGSKTIIANREGKLYENLSGNAGLGTSGSGDVLAGIITGLAARGAYATQAAVWAVYLHAKAGEELSRKIGALGYLASELSAEIPRLMDGLSK